MSVQLFQISGTNSDLDDRRLNEGAQVAVLAKDATDLNFGPGPVTNFSSGSLNAGMVQQPYDATTPEPAGTNKPLGKFEDYASQTVYTAYYNSNNDHYILKTAPGIDPLIVFQDSILDFQVDGDVSIDVLTNRDITDIYITDGNSFPKIITVGLAYPSPIEDWMVSRIRRQPGSAPFVGTKSSFNLIPPAYTLDEISDDYDNLFNGKSLGIQVAYYYIYNNYQESRMGPVSDIVFNQTDLYAQIQIPEYTDYLSDLIFVTQVVFCYRRGNDGVWNVLKRVDNTAPNQVVTDQVAFPNGINIGDTLEVSIPDTNFLPTDPVPSNITNLQFDNTPLLSGVNAIALNRIYDANYTLDYPQWTDLELTLTPAQKAGSVTGNVAQEGLTFWPGGRYGVGVELLDEWGRRIGVVAAKVAEIPDYTLWSQVFDATTPPTTVFGEGNAYWYRDEFNRYQLEWVLTGTLPSWCASYRIVRTREQIATSRYRTVCRLYSWYVKDASEDVLVLFAEDIPENRLIVKGLTSGLTPFYFKGFAVELTMGEPIEFTTGSNLNVKIIGGAGNPGFSDLNGFGQDFEIVKQTNNLFYFKFNDNIAEIANAFYIVKDAVIPVYYPDQSCFFDVEFIFKSTSPDIQYWQTEYDSVLPASGFVSGGAGVIQGDAYYTKYKKINQAIKKTAYQLSPTTVSEVETVYGDPEFIHGAAISMNPIDIYNQDQESSIGQFNVVNELQEQTSHECQVLESDTIILGSKTNGLNKVDSASNEQMPVSNGTIIVLIPTGASQKEPGVMLAWGTVACESIYLDATQITNAGGEITTQPNQVASRTTLGSHRPLLGQYGIQRLRNVCKTPLSTVYGWSHIANDVVRYAANGFEPLGKTYGAYNQLRSVFAGVSAIILNYNQILDEVAIIGTQRRAFVFSERSKKWQGRRSYWNGSADTPQIAASLSLNQYFFLDGEVWQTDPNTLDNSFFGVVADPTLTLILNQSSVLVKRANKVTVIGPRPVSVVVENGIGGTATLVSGKFQPNSVDGSWFAAVPSIDSSPNIDGKPLEGNVISFTFAFLAADFGKISQIMFSNNEPPVQNKP